MLDGIDPHQDAIGIIAKKGIACGECMVEMVSSNRLCICPRCGMKIEESE